MPSAVSLKRPHVSKPLCRQILLFCAAVWSCFSLVYLLSDARVYAALSVLFAPILFGFYRMCAQQADKLRAASKALCLILACLSACALYLSAGVEGRFTALFAGFASFALRAFCIAGLALMLFVLFCLFCVKCTDDSPAAFAAPLSLRGLFMLWGVFLLAWTALYFVCYYPGIFSPDTFSQLYILEGSKDWSNHHPVLHTLLIYVTVCLTGNRPVFFVLLQIVLMTALIACTCFWLRRMRIRKWLWYAIVAYYLAHPIHSTNAFSFIKDTLFSTAVLFFTLCIADLVRTHRDARISHRQILLLAVSALLVLFLRNNGILVIVLSLPALLIVMRGSRLRILAALVLPLAVFGCVQIVVLPKVGIKQTEIEETLGVPLQQMCSVIACGKTFSDDVMQYMDRILPLEDIAESFNPSVFDPIKFHPDFNSDVIGDDFGAFLRVWAHGLVQYPLEYVKAYLSLTRFLWDPMQKAGMIESFTVSPHFTFSEPRPLIPALSSAWIQLVNFSQFSQYAFLTRPFWNCAVFYLCSALCAVVTVQQKRRRLLTLWVPAAAVWVSLMVSTPISTCGRYAYSVFLCIPVFLALAAEAPTGPHEKEEAEQ